MSNDITRRCGAVGVPIVLYNRVQDDDNVSFVTSDNIKGGRAIAHHFADIGVERPAYIAGWENASTQRDREIGFKEGLKERGIELFARGKGEFSSQQAKLATAELFDVNLRQSIPDAVFVANDHMAFAVMDMLRFELGFSVPEDVVVAGYDDVAIAAWKAYDLTSVRQAASQMIEATVEILISAIENPDTKSIHRMIEGPLIIRGSTRR